MSECVILIGLPASGKTTFYRERFAGTHDHVSKDLMRNVRHPERRQQALIAESLAGGRSLVVDNTNATKAIRAAIIEAARRHGARVAGYFFPTEAGDALRRNRAREGRERVPDVAIFTVRKRLEPPVKEEGFDELCLVTIDEWTRAFDIKPA
jgi:predicted kinase